MLYSESQQKETKIVIVTYRLIPDENTAHSIAFKCICYDGPYTL